MQKSSKRIDNLSALWLALNGSVNAQMIDVERNILHLDQKVMEGGERKPGGYAFIWAIQVCAVKKNMVFGRSVHFLYIGHRFSPFWS